MFTKLTVAWTGWARNKCCFLVFPWTVSNPGDRSFLSWELSIMVKVVVSGRCHTKVFSGETVAYWRYYICTPPPVSQSGLAVRLWFVDTVLWLCPSLLTETLTWLSSLPILMQKSFRWWQCSDRYIISLSPHLHTPFPPSLISRTVSADVKHHVYLFTHSTMCSRVGLSVYSSNLMAPIQPSLTGRKQTIYLLAQ